MNQAAISPVEFHNSTLYIVNVQGEPFTPMKPIVEGMGLDWRAQATKLRNNRQRWGVAIITTPTSSGDQQSICMPIRKLPAFMASITPNKVSPALRPKIELYQNECDDALWNYWTQGQATRQPAPLPSLDSPITPDQQCTLQAIVKAKVDAIPKEQRTGGEFPQMWSRFNNHFRIAKYAQLPQSRMSEAVEYLTKMMVGEQKALSPSTLPAPLKSAGRGRHRVKSRTEDTLSELLDEAFYLGNVQRTFDNFFDKLSVITGPLYKQALASMRRTDDNVCTDSLIHTLHFHHLSVRHKIDDAQREAMAACRSAIVVARLLGA